MCSHALQIQNIVSEKELRIKEAMKMMGTSESAIVMSWYIHAKLLAQCLCCRAHLRDTPCPVLMPSMIC